MPHINYCILSWGSQINGIHLPQKRAIRNVSKSNFSSHTEPLFKEHNLLKVQDIYYIAVCKFYYKLVNNHTRLIVTLNETSDDILEMDTTQSWKSFIKFIRERIVASYCYTCNLVICRIYDGT